MFGTMVKLYELCSVRATFDLGLFKIVGLQAGHHSV